jgi:hypothetical protein
MVKLDDKMLKNSFQYEIIDKNAGNFLITNEENKEKLKS